MNLIKHLKEATYPFTETPVIACFGDSVTHGAFESVEGQVAGCAFDFEAVYHNRLRKRLLEINPWLPVSIINAGVAGDHAKASLARLDRDVISHHPHLCVVNFCLNDVTVLSLEDYLASMREIFTRLREAGIPPILMTSNMLNTYRHPDTVAKFYDFAAVTAELQNNGSVDRFVNAIRALAHEMGVTVADTYAKWEAMRDAGEDITLCLDNLINHPKRELHQLFADAIFEVLDQEIV